VEILHTYWKLKISRYFRNIYPLIFDPDDSVRKLFSKIATYGLVKLKYFIQLTFRITPLYWTFIIDNIKFILDISKTFLLFVFDPDAPRGKLFFNTVTYALVKLKKLIQLTFRLTSVNWKHIFDNTKFVDISETFPR
jgi:hypothetical protein